MYKLFSLITLWTISILLIIKLIGKEIFGETFSLWLIGIIFIFLIIIFQRKNI